MTLPKVSVVISVYNGEQTIRDAVVSCLSQDLVDIEVVIINDGSVDRTGNILEDIRREDPRVRVFSQPNMGLTRSLNKGLWLARGELVARLDADDRCAEGRLKAQYEFLSRNPEYVIVGGWSRYGAKIKKFPRSDEEIRKILAWGNPFDHACVMYKKRVVLETGGYDERFRYAQDLELWFRLLAKGKGYNLPELLVIKGVSRDMISERHAQAQLFFKILGEVKNMHLSPDPLLTLKSVLGDSLKLPIYTPAVRGFYRKIRNIWYYKR